MFEQMLADFKSMQKSKKAGESFFRNGAVPSAMVAVPEISDGDRLVGGGKNDAHGRNKFRATSAPSCGKCGGGHMWQPRKSEGLFCWSCVPPAVPGLIGREWVDGIEMKEGVSGESVRESDTAGASAGRSVVERWCYAMPECRCEACRGALVVETTWSDGCGEFKCWSCGKIKTK